jgi:acyl carrier protein
MLTQELLDFVGARARLEPTALTVDTPLFSSGVLDSMAILEMTAFVERKSAVRFEPVDIRLDNLDSVDRIMKFIDSKAGR